MNSNDYCKWRGDISFKNSPFNYVDGLIFCQLSYCDFKGFFDIAKKQSIHELWDRFNHDVNKMSVANSRSFLKDIPTLLGNIAKTDRFGQLIARNYVSIKSEEKTEQFGVLMIDLPKGITVVSFSGTDDSLIGWKESFQISYKSTSSQIDAVDYVNKYCKPFRKYIFLGHSKGGNLALYAGVNCKKSVQNRILKIISYDGPGMYDISSKQEQYNAIKSRYLKIVPQDDVVGMLFDDEKENKIVIKSAGEGVKQHSTPAWQIERDHFIEVDGISSESLKFKELFNDIFVTMDINERENFVEEVFTKMNEIGFNDLYDITLLDLNKIRSMIRNITNLSKETRDILNALLKGTAEIFEQSFEKKVAIFVEDATEQIKSISNSIIK